MTPPSFKATVPNDCRKCGAATLHEILHVEIDRGSTEDVDWYVIEHQIASCMGCQNICFRKSVSSSEETDEHGRPCESVTVYPAPNERKPEVNIPFAYDDEHSYRAKAQQLYEETLKAWNEGLDILSVAGLRATVEAICLDQGATEKDLWGKIGGLVTRGILLKKDADYLHQHRILGNEAVHDMAAPPTEEFEIALQTLEHILRTLYVLPHKNEAFQKMRKARGAKVQ